MPYAFPGFSFFKSSARNWATSLNRATFAGIDVHERLVGFEAGAGHFFAEGFAGARSRGLGLLRQGQFALGDFEEVQHAEGLEQLGDARAGVEQLERAAAWSGRGCFSFRPKPASTPRKVLSISTHSERSSTKQS